MTPVPASLDVSFISNFTGQHRVCWRIAPALIYDCSTLVFCAGLGNPCAVSIPITVDNETCDPVTYEGYVQAACEDPLSVNGRIPFAVVFNPVPTCVATRVSCVSVGVAEATIKAGGSGYDFLNPPSALITGGGGAGATASVTIGATVSTTLAGSGYVDGTYFNVPVINLTGVGTGAQATVTISGGAVISVVITLNGDSCYYPTDTFTFNDADLGGGGGSGFAGEFGIDYGIATLVAITAPGAGYTSIPTITVDAPICPSGVQITSDAILDDCPTQLLGTSCDGSPAQSVVDLPLGQSAIECSQAPLPAAEPGITFTPEGCCYDCVELTMDVDPFSPVGADVYYTDCTTHMIIATPLNPGESLGPVCAVNNSWYYSPNDAVVGVVVGPSCP